MNLRRASTLETSPRPRERQELGPWLLLFGVALALRLIAALVFHSPASREARLDEVAWNLAHGAGLSLNGNAGPTPTSALPPLIPWLLGWGFHWFGHRDLVPVLLTCGLGALAPLLVASLGAMVFGATIGRVAAWLTAVSPLLVLDSGRYVIPIVSGTFLVGALALAASWVKTPRPARAIGVGLALGLAALAHPSAMLLPLIVVVWAWVPLGLTLAASDRRRQTLLLLAGFLVLVGPWTLRNALVARAANPVAPALGTELLAGNNPTVWSDPSRRGGRIEVWSVDPYAASLRSRSEREADAWALAGAGHFLDERRREWAAMAVAKVARFWLPSRTDWTGRAARPWWRDVFGVWSVIAIPFAAFGWIGTWSSPRRWFQSFPALVALYFTALAVVFHGDPAARIPIEPLVLLYAASGWDALRRRRRSRGRRFEVIEGRGDSGADFTRTRTRAPAP